MLCYLENIYGKSLPFLVLFLLLSVKLSFIKTETTRRRSRSAPKAKFNKAFSALFEVPKLSSSLYLSLSCAVNIANMQQQQQQKCWKKYRIAGKCCGKFARVHREKSRFIEQTRDESETMKITMMMIMMMRLCGWLGCGSAQWKSPLSREIVLNGEENNLKSRRLNLYSLWEA